jgi:SAM-dependent methyltransferase
MTTDYVHVTEVAGDSVSQEQVERMYCRYSFARQYSVGRDVLELGCGSGQGLGYRGGVAKKIIGADYSWPLLKLAKEYYQDRIPLIQLDTQVLPIKDQSFDVIILFEAIYYLKDPDLFIKECLRVLRPKGTILICNPNKDLPDFNPSPHSYRYFSAPDFAKMFEPYGLQVECFADCEVDYDSLKQRFLAFVKKMMVKFDLMPKTMAGKKLLKRIVFGKLVTLPSELSEESGALQTPCIIDSTTPDVSHKVIFSVAHKN